MQECTRQEVSANINNEFLQIYKRKGDFTQQFNFHTLK